MTETITAPAIATAKHLPKAKILRTLHGYVLEWGCEYLPGPIFKPERNKPFTFREGCFDRCLARKPVIHLTKDMDSDFDFARTSDNTLTLVSDDVGLLAHVVLLDTPLNRSLCELIDAGKIRGWSHKAQPILGGMRVTRENGATFTEHLHANLLQVTLVHRKFPRARTRKTPIFFFCNPNPMGATNVR